MLKLDLPRPETPTHPPVGEPELSKALIARLDALEQANLEAERARKRLEFEWDEWYDKFRLLFARLSRRMQQEAKDATEAENGPQDAPQTTIDRAAVVRQPQFRRSNYGG